MDILRGYGFGPNLQKLIKRFRDNREAVLTAGKFFGRLFRTERGVFQEYLVSSNIFNIVVGAVIRWFY